MAEKYSVSKPSKSRDAAERKMADFTRQKMLKNKDKPGPRGDGYMGDGAYSTKRDFAKEGQYKNQTYAEKAESGRFAREASRAEANTGRGYAEGNWRRTGETLKKESTAEGTVARKKLVEKYQEEERQLALARRHRNRAK